MSKYTRSILAQWCHRRPTKVWQKGLLKQGCWNCWGGQCQWGPTPTHVLRDQLNLSQSGEQITCALTFYTLITICPARFSDPPTSLSRQRRLRLCFLAFESVFHSSCVRGACWAPAALPIRCFQKEAKVCLC